MQLINVERSVKIPRAALHPLLIRERKFIEISYDRREVRPQFHTKPIGVAVFNPAVPAVNDIFVHLTGFGTLYSDLIELSALCLRHFLFLPAVELADDRYTLRLGCEGPENHSVLLNMRAQVSVRVIDLTHVEFLKVHDSSYCSSLLSSMSAESGSLSCIFFAISRISCALSTVTLT